MAVDSKAKGMRGELAARDLLREATGLQWERTPGSGALGAQQKLKGDLWVPGEKNLMTVEVKNYESDEFGLGVLSNKSNVFMGWLKQAVREADENNNDWMLMVKWNRSPWFVAFSHALMQDKIKASNYLIMATSTYPTTAIYLFDEIKTQLKQELFIRV